MMITKATASSATETAAERVVGCGVSSSSRSRGGGGFGGDREDLVQSTKRKTSRTSVLQRGSVHIIIIIDPMRVFVVATRTTLVSSVGARGATGAMGTVVVAEKEVEEGAEEEKEDEAVKKKKSKKDDENNNNGVLLRMKIWCFSRRRRSPAGSSR